MKCFLCNNQITKKNPITLMHSKVVTIGEKNQHKLNLSAGSENDLKGNFFEKFLGCQDLGEWRGGVTIKLPAMSEVYQLN